MKATTDKRRVEWVTLKNGQRIKMRAIRQHERRAPRLTLYGTVGYG